MRNVIPEKEKFTKVTTCKPPGTPIQLRGSIPGEHTLKGGNANVQVVARDSANERKITLKKKLAEGGEGAVFTTSIKGYVAKIYKREKLITDKREKLNTMINKPINCPGVCFPVAMIYNAENELVGYLMPEAHGHELGKSVFLPKLLLQKFPGWTRKQTVQLCITILEKISYLNERRIILGDINPQNIIVKSPTDVYFVDCDSYQIEGFPCPVGTPNFTPPEALGKDFKTFLRTKQMENFAVAVLMFMIMLPGKHPYSSVGGETPEKNIRNGNFPYPHSFESGDKVPRGQWGYIWSHMSFKARDAFFNTFHKGGEYFEPQNRLYPDAWMEIFKGYLHGMQFMADNDPMAVDIFPTRIKMQKCKAEECNNRFVPDIDNYCPFCEKHRYLWRQASNRNNQLTNGTNASRTTSQHKKLCPYCKTELIPEYFKYCDKCKDKVIATRECVNCGKKFSVTLSLSTWEEKTGAKKNQCDVCKEAGCVDSPCGHSQQKPLHTTPSIGKKPTAQSKIVNFSSHSKNPQQTVGKVKQPSSSPKTKKITTGSTGSSQNTNKTTKWTLIILGFFLILLFALSQSPKIEPNQSINQTNTTVAGSPSSDEIIDRLTNGKKVAYSELRQVIAPRRAVSPEDSFFSGGSYVIGQGSYQLPPGLYYLEGSPEEYGVVIFFLQDKEDRSQYGFIGSVFYYDNYFLQFEEGQIVKISLPEGANFYRAEDLVFSPEEEIDSGCYRVGIDIPPGRYALYDKGLALEQPSGAYISDSADINAISNASYIPLEDGYAEVEVIDGQQIELCGVTAAPI